MALTDFGALSAANKKVWSARTWRQGLDDSFFFASGMVGAGTEDAGKPVHLVNELTETQGGDKCIMQLVAELEGDGTAGDNRLTDNEEALVNDEQTITIDMLRHAVKSKGRMSQQRTVIKFRAQARQKLSYWLGNKIDEMGFLTLHGRAYTLKLDGSTRSGSSQLAQLAFASDVTAPTTNRIMYAGPATSEATLTNNDTMSWNLLTKIKATAQRKRIKPIRVGGKTYWIVLMSVEQERDLKNDSTYQTIVSRAGGTGEKNPLFNGSFAVVEGLVLMAHAKTYQTGGLSSGSKWGASGTVNGAQAQLIGAQALGFAKIGEPFYEEADIDDYGNQPGLGYGRMIGFLKPVFRSLYDNGTDEDFGTITLKTATNP